MAILNKSGTPSPCSRLWPANAQIPGLLAGEAIAAGDACYVKSDGLVWKSIGTSANAAARVDGFAAEAAASGEACTLLFDMNFHYGAGQTPGARYYVNQTTAGALQDSASTGGTEAVAFAVDATRIHVFQSRY